MRRLSLLRRPLIDRRILHFDVPLAQQKTREAAVLTFINGVVCGGFLGLGIVWWALGVTHHWWDYVVPLLFVWVSARDVFAKRCQNEWSEQSHRWRQRILPIPSFVVLVFWSWANVTDVSRHLGSG